MRKLTLGIALFVIIVACDKSDSGPKLSGNTIAERAATIESYVGEWEYLLDGQPYQKIVIEKKGTDYVFNHYIKLAGAYKLDQEKYYSPQTILAKDYVTWDKSPNFHPYIPLNTVYSIDQGLFYRVISGKKQLEIGLNNYFPVIP